MKQKFSQKFQKIGFIDSLLEGEIGVDGEQLKNRILTIFIKEFQESVQIVYKIILICIFGSILKHIQQSSENGACEVAFYVCYLIVSVLIVRYFTIVVDLCKNTVKLLNTFNGVFSPIMVIYLTISGNVTFASMIQPLIMFVITLMSNMTQLFFIPGILIATVLSLVSNISDIVDVSPIEKLVKNGILRFIEVALIIFIGLLSLEGTLASHIDSTISKTAKTMISSTIPVVGKLIGDAADSVLGATLVSKSAMGFVGALVVISIAVIPLMKALIILLMFHVGGTISESFMDTRISKCFSIICDAIQTLTGILGMIVIMYIIQIAFLMKVKI